MTTTTQLPRIRSHQPFGPRVSTRTKTNLRELWADGVATVAAVTLSSILVFEALRLLVS